MAAIPALEAGLNVTICEKGRLLDNCGSVGCGVDHYLTVMESGYEWDTPEFLIKHLPELTDGIVDIEVAGRTTSLVVTTIFTVIIYVLFAEVFKIQLYHGVLEPLVNNL